MMVTFILAKDSKESQLKVTCETGMFALLTSCHEAFPYNPWYCPVAAEHPHPMTDGNQGDKA